MRPRRAKQQRPVRRHAHLPRLPPLLCNDLAVSSMHEPPAVRGTDSAANRRVECSPGAARGGRVARKASAAFRPTSGSSRQSMTVLPSQQRQVTRSTQRRRRGGRPSVWKSGGEPRLPKGSLPRFTLGCFLLSVRGSSRARRQPMRTRTETSLLIDVRSPPRIPFRSRRSGRVTLRDNLECLCNRLCLP